MNPTLLALIPSLVKGAVQIFTDKKAFKENLKAKSTKAAVATAAAAVLAPETMAQGGEETQLAMAITTVILFLLRKYQPK